MSFSKHASKFSLICATLAFGIGMTACDPVPRHTLTSEEKVADMMWIYSQFGQNYAPLEMKQRLHNFNYETLKTQYIELAKKTNSNEEFYDLMYKFVAEFQDGHTSAALTNSSLPNRATVSFLGFNGIRKGDNFLVKDLLPTIKPGSNFPIHAGDEIAKINGKDLKSVVVSEQLQYRNVGNMESNYTILMPRLFTRISTTNGSPTDANAAITVLRDDPDAQDKAIEQASLISDSLKKAAAVKAANEKPMKKEVTFTIPWVTKDLAKFKQEQDDAKAVKKDADAGDASNKDQEASSDFESFDTAAAKPTATPLPSSSNPEENFLMVDDGNQKLKFNFIGFDGRVQMPFDFIQRVTANVRSKISDSFRFLDNYASWKVVAEDAKPKTSRDNFNENRAAMKDQTFLETAKTFTAYFAPRYLLDKDGKRTGEKKLIGYIYIDTFSPDGDEDKIVAEFKQTLKTFKNVGVKDLIIDTINNGGGSLVLGMKMAQALSNNVVEMPKIQVRLSDTWLDQYETESLNGKSDAEKELARRTLETFRNEQKTGKVLSSPVTTSDLLAPYQIQPNEDLAQPFNIVLITNEMCASMCDIFAGILQDNKMAKIVGTNTMGAGGNVVNHKQAPNSHLDLRQTESLLLRADGSYLENAGVKPDVAIPVSESANNKYIDVLKKAIDLIVKS